jgi:UDP-glucose 4-epimerase
VRLVITGGAGFIGCNLARLALSRGHDVCVLDDFSTGFPQNVAGLDVDLVEGSILDPVALQKAVTGADSVIHLAALGSVPRSIADPRRTHEVNARGTLEVLESARAADVGHVVSASSSSVYGLNPALPKSEREWTRPLSPYAVSKLATEQYTLAYQQSYGLDTLAFRFFNVFGPWQRAGHAYAAVVPIFLDALLHGVPLPVNGDGTNSRDFTFVGTVVSVLLDASERRVTHPEPVNLAFGTNTSILSLVDEMAAVSDTSPQVEFREPRPGDVAHSQADNASLMSLFPDVLPVSLREGLEQTLAWFQIEASS